MRLVHYRELIAQPPGTLFQRISVERSSDRQIYALVEAPTRPGGKIKVRTAHSSNLYSFQYMAGAGSVMLSDVDHKEVIRTGTVDPETMFYSVNPAVADLQFAAGDHFLLYEKADLAILRTFIDGAMDGKACTVGIDCSEERERELRIRAQSKD